MTTTTWTTTTMTTTTAEPDDSLLEALAEALDRRLVSHSRLSSTVSGDGLVVAEEVEFATENGTEKHLIYIETSPPGGERDGVLTFVDESTGDRVAVWVYPNDPALPALEAAVFPDAAAVLLRRLGVADVDQVTLKLEAYRPGKRAVIRVDSGAGTVFLKVVAPGAAEVFAQRHNDWLAAGVPVPQVLGWSEDGLLALAALGGVPTPDVITRLTPEPFVTALIELQEQIARLPSSDSARASLSSRLGWYERRLTVSAPERGLQIRAVAGRIEELLAAAPSDVQVTVHGDLHIGQLFLNPATDAIDGVLDIDTAGLGDPADDAAALYAHLIVTALANSGQPTIVSACEELADLWEKSWHAREDTSFAIRATAIAATHLLAHALNRLPDTGTLLSSAERLLSNIRGL
jgi:aminoglycoside phosphotransferase